MRYNRFDPRSQRLWQEKTTFGSQRNFRRHGFQLAGYNNGLHHRLSQNRSFRNLSLWPSLLSNTRAIHAFRCQWV